MAIPSLASPAMLAVQQKVNTLMKQGVPTAQIGQILQNEVLPTGAVPLTQLWQLMNYVKANAQKAQMPPPDSVAVQLADKVKAIAEQKMHPLGQVPQMGLPPTGSPVPPSGPPGPSAGPPPPQGIPSLPAPGVGQPGAYAGGGIVSFQKGGDTSDWEDAADIFKGVGSDAFYGTVGLLNQPGNAYDWLTGKTDEGIRALADYYRRGKTPAQAAPGEQPTDGAGRPYSLTGPPPQPGAFSGPYKPQFAMSDMIPTPYAPTPPNTLDEASSSDRLGAGIGSIKRPDYIDVQKDPTLDEEFANAQRGYDKLGLGSMSKEANRYAADEEAKSAKENKYDRNLALADAGFRMAQAASAGGATFMGAAGAGGSELAKGLMAAKEKQDQSAERIENLKLKALEAADQGKEKVFETAMKDLQAKSSENRADVRANASMSVEYMKAQAEAMIAAHHDAVLRAASHLREDATLDAMRKKYYETNDPSILTQMEIYIKHAYPTVIASQVGAASKEGIAAMRDPVNILGRLQDVQQGGGGGDSGFSWKQVGP